MKKTTIQDALAAIQRCIDEAAGQGCTVNFYIEVLTPPIDVNGVPHGSRAQLDFPSGRRPLVPSCATPSFAGREDIWQRAYHYGFVDVNLQPLMRDKSGVAILAAAMKKAMADPQVTYHHFERLWHVDKLAKAYSDAIRHVKGQTLYNKLVRILS